MEAPRLRGAGHQCAGGVVRMPLYDVIVQIDAAGTEIAHRCEADDVPSAWNRAILERGLHGKRGFVIRIEEVKVVTLDDGATLRL